MAKKHEPGSPSKPGTGTGRPDNLTKADGPRRPCWSALPTRRQRVFAEEYCIDLDTRRAAIVAGLSYGQARNVMMEARMKAAIEETLQLRAQQAGIRSEDILRDLRLVADKCMGRIPVTKVVKVKKAVGKGKKQRLVDVEEVREDSIWDASGANTALQNLGRHKKLFTDVVESYYGPLGDATDEKLDDYVKWAERQPEIEETRAKLAKH